MFAIPPLLDDIGQLSIAELDALPIAELDHLIARVSSVRDTARQYEAALHCALNNRFAKPAQVLRHEAGKSTGTVRFESEGYVVIADLPKRTDYDQMRLREAVEALRKWGENPEDYVGIEIKVSETKYSAWPPGIRELFEPARTVKTGKPSYRLEKIRSDGSDLAANDSQFGEVL